MRIRLDFYFIFILFFFMDNIWVVRFQMVASLSKLFAVYFLHRTWKRQGYVWNELKMRADMVYLCYLGPTEYDGSGPCKKLQAQNNKLQMEIRSVHQYWLDRNVAWQGRTWPLGWIISCSISDGLVHPVLKVYIQEKKARKKFSLCWAVNDNKHVRACFRMYSALEGIHKWGFDVVLFTNIQLLIFPKSFCGNGIPETHRPVSTVVVIRSAAHVFEHTPNSFQHGWELEINIGHEDSAFWVVIT